MRRRWPGASQEVIAITLGLSQRHVSTLLADEVRRPRVLTVRALAVALGTSEEVIRAGFRHGAR